MIMQKLLTYVKHGFPDCKSKMYLETQKFWNYRLNLVLSNDLVFYGNRLVVPDSLKKEILNILHGAHQGTRGMEL